MATRLKQSLVANEVEAEPRLLNMDEGLKQSPYPDNRVEAEPCCPTRLKQSPVAVSDSDEGLKQSPYPDNRVEAEPCCQRG